MQEEKNLKPWRLSSPGKNRLLKYLIPGFAKRPGFLLFFSYLFSKIKIILFPIHIPIQHGFKGSGIIF